jgi:hypothetical protein
VGSPNFMRLSLMKSHTLPFVGSAYRKSGYLALFWRDVGNRTAIDRQPLNTSEFRKEKDLINQSPRSPLGPQLNSTAPHK